MACETIVLTAHVGAIPNLTKDEYNGFLIKNNSPSCIKKNIYKVLETKKNR